MEHSSSNALIWHGTPYACCNSSLTTTLEPKSAEFCTIAIWIPRYPGHPIGYSGGCKCSTNVECLLCIQKNNSAFISKVGGAISLSSMTTSMVRTAMSCDTHRLHLHGPERIRRSIQRPCTLAAARTASLTPAMLFNRPKGGVSWGRDIPARAKVAACHSLASSTRSIRPSGHLWNNVKVLHCCRAPVILSLTLYQVLMLCLGPLLPVLNALAFRRNPGG